MNAIPYQSNAGKKNIALSSVQCKDVEMSKFNKSFDAFFEIYNGKAYQPKLRSIIRAFAAALATYSSVNKLIKKEDIVEVENLLRKIYFDCSKSSRREFKRAIVNARDGKKVSVERVLNHLMENLTEGERLNILTSVYELVDADGLRTPSEQLFIESLQTAV